MKRLLVCAILFLCSCAKTPEKSVLVFGYFPNLTHMQAVIGIARGDFQKKLGDNVRIEPKVFNAGPSAMEAILAGSLDLTYIGPNPAINGYIKSKGAALRIIAGSASGGAALVVRNDAGIASIQDFAGKRIASPQLGNTQDVALRAWLQKNGFTLKEKGGNVEVMPVKNPDQLTLFLKKELDAAWAVEPWVTRLIGEGNGRLFLDERTLWPNGRFTTADIVASTKLLQSRPDLAAKIVEAHVELTQWIQQNPEEAKTLFNNEPAKLTGKPLPKAVLDSAFARMDVTYDPIRSSLTASAQAAFDQGFLGKEKPELSGIYDLKALNEVLTKKGLAPIE